MIYRYKGNLYRILFKMAEICTGQKPNKSKSSILIFYWKFYWTGSVYTGHFIGSFHLVWCILLPNGIFDSRLLKALLLGANIWLSSWYAWFADFCYWVAVAQWLPLLIIVNMQSKWRWMIIPVQVYEKNNRVGSLWYPILSLIWKFSSESTNLIMATAFWY